MYLWLALKPYSFVQAISWQSYATNKPVQIIKNRSYDLNIPKVKSMKSTYVGAFLLELLFQPFLISLLRYLRVAPHLERFGHRAGHLASHLLTSLPRLPRGWRAKWRITRVPDEIRRALPRTIVSGECCVNFLIRTSLPIVLTAVDPSGLKDICRYRLIFIF